MKKSVKELKKWLETMDDEAEISVGVYKNNKEKQFIYVTEWNEEGIKKEKEFLVSEEEV